MCDSIVFRNHGPVVLNIRPNRLMTDMSIDSVGKSSFGHHGSRQLTTGVDVVETLDGVLLSIFAPRVSHGLAPSPGSRTGKDTLHSEEVDR